MPAQDSARHSVVGIAGSLRSGSYNRALLQTAVELSGPEMHIDPFDLADIPLYNYDFEQHGDPAPVREFKETIARADGVLIATPEYQQGVPGVLKNALDWASRPLGSRCCRTCLSPSWVPVLA